MSFSNEGFSIEMDVVYWADIVVETEVEDVKAEAAPAPAPAPSCSVSPR